MSDQTTFNRIQVTPMHDLSPLLTHPDFQQGRDEAQKYFSEEYALAPLTEDQMIEVVELVLLSDLATWGELFCSDLGYVFGTINEGLTYTSNTTSSSRDLSALLTHPDFQRGVADAQNHFGEYYDSMLTEDQMIQEVENNLSRAITEKSRLADAALGGSSFSYIHRLGFVLGTINQGLGENTSDSNYVSPTPSET